jgi:hypothetical protein
MHGRDNGISLLTLSGNCPFCSTGNLTGLFCRLPVWENTDTSEGLTNVSDPVCNCGYMLQTTKHVLLVCPLLINARREFIIKINNIPNLNPDFFKLTKSK